MTDNGWEEKAYIKKNYYDDDGRVLIIHKATKKQITYSIYDFYDLNYTNFCLGKCFRNTFRKKCNKDRIALGRFNFFYPQFYQSLLEDYPYYDKIDINLINIENCGCPECKALIEYIND